MEKNKKMSFDFEKLLDNSVKTHGHLCPGQVLGVRMSILGLREIGVGDPKGEDRKKLIVYVEIDRCGQDPGYRGIQEQSKELFSRN
jgi:formylmethanofuran dehydrogenase subunit E